MKSKMYKPLAIQYVDPLIIMTLSKAYPNDSDFGQEVRKYLDSCDDAISQDSIFFKLSKMRKLANDPTGYDEIINNLQNNDDEE